jgi:Aromatic-ring-opening dioxygenase LigAB, LigA subunit
VSAYGINKACYLMQASPTFRQRMRVDAAGALTELPLSTKERQALLDADVATLKRLGASEILLSRIPRFGLLNLSREQYIERMRTLLD